MKRWMTSLFTAWATGEIKLPLDAAGNVATEDLVFLLTGLGIEHGVDARRVAEVAQRFCSDHNLVYNSKAGRALLAAEEDDELDIHK